MATPTLNVGGLSSGMDTQSIIDKLVALAQQPLTSLQKQQAAYKTQVSTLGDLTSKLGALATAADDLASGGALGLKATSTNTAFTAVPGTSAVAGSYDISVSSLASAAKWRSRPFAADDALQAGTFTISVNGVDYPPAPDGGGLPGIEVTEGESLAELASDINGSGAPVTAAVLDDGTRKYLSISAKSTGFKGEDASSALQLSFTDGAGQGLDPTSTDPLDPTAAPVSQAARNAVFTVDGLQFTRTSNIVTDALPGTTLTLQKLSPLDPGTSAPSPEALTVADDTDATRTRLQTFVDAYNAVMQLVQKQTDVSSTTNRTTTLAGDGSVRALEQALQSIGSSEVPGLATVRTLADLGVKTQRDGTLAIDKDVLSAAIARDPSAVNAIFSDRTAGVGKLTASLVDTYTAPAVGLLVIRQDGLNDDIAAMDGQAASLQARINAYRQSLADQFTAMETVVGQYKSIGNFLTQQANAASASK